MGCELGKPSMVAAIGEEVEDEDPAAFSETQIDTIRSTWPLLSARPVEVGVEVFSRIFRNSTAIRNMFERFNVHDAEYLSEVPIFRQHAEVFMQTLGALVEGLEDPGEGLKNDLMSLGAGHATFEGFRAEFFQIFVKCLLEVWEAELGEEFISEVRNTWTHFFAYIVSQMVAGYEFHVEEKKRRAHQGDAVTPDNGLGTNGKSYEWTT